eukprot:scaffold604_cov20-Tisochrysis_lutea.AAC.2
MREKGTLLCAGEHMLLSAAYARSGDARLTQAVACTSFSGHHVTWHVQVREALACRIFAVWMRTCP